MSDSRNFGVLHLYRGLEAKLYQTLLASGIMFLTYEYFLMVTLALFGFNK